MAVTAAPNTYAIPDEPAPFLPSRCPLCHAAPCRCALVSTYCEWCGVSPCRCLRRTTCVCGVEFTAASTRDIPGAVMAHQRTFRHIAWRERFDS